MYDVHAKIYYNICSPWLYNATSWYTFYSMKNISEETAKSSIANPMSQKCSNTYFSKLYSIFLNLWSKFEKHLFFENTNILFVCKLKYTPYKCDVNRSSYPKSSIAKPMSQKCWNTYFLIFTIFFKFYGQSFKTFIFENINILFVCKLKYTHNYDIRKSAYPKSSIAKPMNQKYSKAYFPNFLRIFWIYDQSFKKKCFH